MVILPSYVKLQEGISCIYQSLPDPMDPLVSFPENSDWVPIMVDVYPFSYTHIQDITLIITLFCVTLRLHTVTHNDIQVHSMTYKKYYNMQQYHITLQ